MPQIDIPSFLDWEERKAKKPKDIEDEPSINSSFTSILPAWKTKRNYALMEINYQRFKLFERGNVHLKRAILELLGWFLYVNPNDYKKEMQELLNYVNENKKKFKIFWNQKLEVY